MELVVDRRVAASTAGVVVIEAIKLIVHKCGSRARQLALANLPRQMHRPNCRCTSRIAGELKGPMDETYFACHHVSIGPHTTTDIAHDVCVGGMQGRQDRLPFHASGKVEAS